MKEITRRDVRELLDTIAARPAPIVANRVRSLLHKLFNVAIELDVVEVNHVERGATEVYDRHSYDAEKRVALDAWARTLAGTIEQKDGANVVAFAARS